MGNVYEAPPAAREHQDAAARDNTTALRGASAVPDPMIFQKSPSPRAVVLVLVR